MKMGFSWVLPLVVKKGISIGLERGTDETKLETARNLLAMGLSLEQIAQGTAIPLETVRQLVLTT